MICRLDQRTKFRPIASAPAFTATRADCASRTPQIFVQVLDWADGVERIGFEPGQSDSGDLQELFYRGNDLRRLDWLRNIRVRAQLQCPLTILL